MGSNEKQLEICESTQWYFSNLSALFLNCTLKRSPELPRTSGLIDIAVSIMEKCGVRTETLRPADYDIAYGVYGDMREHGWAGDDWRKIYQQVRAADTLVLTTPIWLGEKSPLCAQVVERLFGNSADPNDEGQYA